MKGYPQYKDSRVEWLGNIPLHWSVKQIKHVKSKEPNAFVDGPFGSNLKSIHYVDDGEVNVIESGFITTGQFISKKFKTITNEHFQTIIRSECKLDDIIIAKIGANFGMSGILPDIGKRAVVSGNSLKLTIDQQDNSVRFIHYQLVTLKKLGIFDLIVNATAQPALSLGTLNELKLACPPKHEQVDIVDYLDKKTSQIDDLIARKKRLIELLQEQRTALINRAVTKGLNPDAPMKDSGIEWLGEVPAHWDIKKFKHLGRVIGGFAFKSSSFSESGTRVLKISNIHPMSIDWSDISYLPQKFVTSHADYLVNHGSLVFALTRPIISTGIKVAILSNHTNEPILLNQRTGVFQSNGSIDIDYLKYVVTCEYFIHGFKNKLKSTNQPNISTEEIGNLIVLVPPNEEQVELGKHLNRITTDFEKLIQHETDSISLLSEYRTSLISEAVTGKIDVSDEVSA